MGGIAERRGEGYHIGIPSTPMTPEEIFHLNVRGFRQSLLEKHGRIVGTLAYFLKGRKRLRELSEEVVMRAIRVKDNKYFFIHGHYCIPLL